MAFSAGGSCGTVSVDEAIVKGDDGGGGAGTGLAVEGDGDWTEATAAACCIWTSCLCKSANWNINKAHYHNCSTVHLILCLYEF